MKEKIKMMIVMIPCWSKTIFFPNEEAETSDEANVVGLDRNIFISL